MQHMSGQHLNWTMVDDDWTIYYGDRPKNCITILIIKRDTGRLDDVLSLLLSYIYYIFRVMTRIAMLNRAKSSHDAEKQVCKKCETF